MPGRLCRVVVLTAVACAVAAPSPAVAGESPDPSVGLAVVIGPDPIPGALALSVPAVPDVFTRSHPHPVVREYTGVLDLGVTDTRTLDQGDLDGGWTVTGMSTTPTSTGAVHGPTLARWLGWTPWLLSDADWVIDPQLTHGYRSRTEAMGPESARTLLKGSPWQDTARGTPTIALYTHGPDTPGASTITVSLFE